MRRLSFEVTELMALQVKSTVATLLDAPEWQEDTMFQQLDSSKRAASI
jgi:hypothetical protein